MRLLEESSLKPPVQKHNELFVTVFIGAVFVVLFEVVICVVGSLGLVVVVVVSEVFCGAVVVCALDVVCGVVVCALVDVALVVVCGVVAAAAARLLNDSFEFSFSMLE